MQIDVSINCHVEGFEYKKVIKDENGRLLSLDPDNTKQTVVCNKVLQTSGP